MSKGYKAKHFYSVPIDIQETAPANKLFMVNEGSLTFSKLQAKFDKLRESSMDETPRTVFVSKWVADDPDMMRLLTEGPKSRKR